MQAAFDEAFRLHRAGRIADAIQRYLQILPQAPDDARLMFLLGSAYVQAGQHTKALNMLEQSLNVLPSNASALSNAAVSLHALGRFEEAIACCDNALAIQPALVEARANRANALVDRAAMLRGKNRPHEALACFEQVLALDPAHAIALTGRAAVLRDLDRSDLALRDAESALALAPGDAQVLNCHGAVLADLGRHDEAMASLDRARAAAPSKSEPLVHKALLSLLRGDYREGWALYENRVKPAVAAPRWTGAEDIRGQTVLAISEQGFGDVFQMCRYLPLLRARGAEVIASVPAPLVSTVSSLGAGIQCVPNGGPPVAFHRYIPMMSLPLAFGTRLDTVPADVPYLLAAPGKAAAWKDRLGAQRQPRVGLAWSGSALHRRNATRSIPLGLLEPLFGLGVEIHSLQTEYAESDRDALAAMPLHRHEDALKDFSDTAALIDAMDLVVCIDTAVAHLAGAMGKPVWIALPFVPDFRWLLDRRDSPWYPSATLYRQRAMGDWGGVVAELVADLHSLGL